ncbi:BTB/POZ fold, partial [Rhypophila sp. PSN 637]
LSEFKSGQFSDCKVKCGDRVWNLHKFVLCSRSSFFKTAFTGGLLECRTSEITLQEQDPDRVGIMLEYIYSGNCKWPRTTFCRVSSFGALLILENRVQALY